MPDLNSATPKRHISPIRFDLAGSDTSNGSQDQSGDVLNQSLEENPEESLYFGAAEADESIGPSTGNSPTKMPKLIKVYFVISKKYFYCIFRTLKRVQNLCLNGYVYLKMMNFIVIY